MTDMTAGLGWPDPPPEGGTGPGAAAPPGDGEPPRRAPSGLGWPGAQAAPGPAGSELETP